MSAPPETLAAVAAASRRWLSGCQYHPRYISALAGLLQQILLSERYHPPGVLATGQQILRCYLPAVCLPNI